MHKALMSHWKTTDKIIVDTPELPPVATERGHEADLPDFLERMMFPDTVSYRPDDILAKVDRAGMGVSLESRISLLDRRLVAFPWRLPINLKMRHGQGKWLLKQVLPRIILPWQGSTQVFGNERINRFKFP